jgi:hypothetical protein
MGSVILLSQGYILQWVDSVDRSDSSNMLETANV